LGPGRFLRFGARTGIEPGDGVQAQPGALPVSEMGTASVQDFPTYSAGDWDRAPGESRILGERCVESEVRGQRSEVRDILPGYAGRNRFAYYDDQRSGRGWLGRRRN